MRPRSSTLATGGSVPEARPRRTMSVSTKTNRPTPRPRPGVRLERLGEVEARVEVESVYSTPFSEQSGSRRRVSSVSSSSSSLSSASSSSNPSSPTSPQSPEQFWAKYKRSSTEGKKFRNIFSHLTLSETEPDEEPLYAEIYGSNPPRQPPLPRKNSVSKPPARPPYPASSIKKL